MIAAVTSQHKLDVVYELTMMVRLELHPTQEPQKKLDAMEDRLAYIDIWSLMNQSAIIAIEVETH